MANKKQTLAGLASAASAPTGEVSALDPETLLRALPTKGLADRLGITIVELTPKRVVAKMPIDERTRQPFGILHGGASVALAETVASLGALLNVDLDRDMAVGLEINANHLRAKREGMVTATGVPVHVGRSTQVWEVRILDESERPVCVSRCTLAVVPRERADPRTKSP
jgi:uncharacterized protein (TIGR00369 family)